jgi:hypothetical protein
MAAPDSTLLTALRAGTVARHLFFKMPHSAGDVYAWDGLGSFELSGEVYFGIGNAASIQGVSTSADLQNSTIDVTIDGVPRTAMLTGSTVRGSAVTLTAAWINEAGSVVASRVLFSGLASNIRSKVDGDTLSLTVRVRGKMADWAKSPASFYNERDQERLYAGDTGFQFVKTIENGTTSGWGETEEATTSRVFFANLQVAIDDLLGDVIGNAIYGPGSTYPGGVFSFGLVSGSTVPWTEETSGAGATAGPFQYVKVGGNDVYLDVAGDARTAGGKKLFANGVSGEYLRKQGTIASVGSATADYIGTSSVLGLTRLLKNGTAYSGRDSRNLVYNNKGRGYPYWNGTNFIDYVAGTVYLEDVTGSAVTLSGGRMQVGGADCTISSTGAVRSPGGRFIVPTGFTGADGYFLRVWT